MFIRKTIPAYKRLLESELERSLKGLRSQTPGSDEHKKIMDASVTLHDMMDENPDTVKKDTLALIAGNLLGIILVIKHEQVGNFISTKAFGLLIRPR